MAVRITPSMSKTIVAQQSAPRVYPKSRSANVVPKKAYKKKARKYAVAKSFKQAYNKMAPSKEIRYDATQLALSSDLLGNRVHYDILTAIAQGTQLNQRLGRSLHMSYVKIKGTVQSNSTLKTKFLRLMIIRDNSGTGTVLNASTHGDLYKDETFTDRAPSGVQKDGRYTINKEKYHVYYDHVYKIPLETEGCLVFNRTVRINRYVNYPQASSGSVPVNGRIYLLYNLFDGDNVSSATTVICSLQVRAFFKDGRY